MLRFNQSHENPRSLGEILDTLPDVADLFAKLGRDPALSERTAKNLAEMKRLVRAEVTDFPAFQIAIRAAAAKTAEDSARFEIRDQELLDAALEAGDDESAILGILNRNPVYEQVPFVERVPVLRGGAITWLTPMEHSTIRKRPSDPIRFLQLAQELEGLYMKAHPSRHDGPRVEVLGAIARLKRELNRDKAYIPTAIQALEAKLAAFETESVQPAAQAACAALSGLLLSIEQARVECAGGRIRRGRRKQLRETGASDASRYLAHARLHIPQLTSHILAALLAPAQLEVIRWPGWTVMRAARLIRNEIQAGFFDAAEIAERIRKLEAQGLYVTSLLFPLLRLHPAPRAQAMTRVG